MYLPHQSFAEKADKRMRQDPSWMCGWENPGCHLGTGAPKAKENNLSW